MKHFIMLSLVALLLCTTGNMFAAEKASGAKNQKVVMKVGDTTQFRMDSFPSTGLSAECVIKNPNLLSVSEKIVYANPKQAIDPIPGGDRSEKVFELKALKKGKTTVKFFENWRGKKTLKQIVNIVIK